MPRWTLNRRHALRTTAAGAAALIVDPGTVVSAAKNSRPRLALLGAGWQPETKRRGRGIAIGRQAAQWGDIVAICEVDAVAGEYAREAIREALQPHVTLVPDVVPDYRRVIDRDDIDAVLIATPDHWHAKMAIEAMRSGKDVYCEKPVAVTVDEGKQIRRAVEETQRVFQVGTQQRTEYQGRFVRAVALAREGRVGNITRIRVGLEPGWEGGPFMTSAPPRHLDFNAWLGPAPDTPYIRERTHRTFRWWYEYAGGNITDWGAHHVDIAQAALGEQHSGPVSVSGTARMNQPLRDGWPTRSDYYNTPIEFSVTCRFASGKEIVIETGRNGITFEGDRGRYFVNRGTLEGRPVAALQDQPLPDGAVEQVWGRPLPMSHMADFFECLQTRGEPISDIRTHHRILTTCHLANLCLRLGRPLTWDPQAEQIVGDDQASGLLARAYREGYAIEG